MELVELDSVGLNLGIASSVLLRMISMVINCFNLLFNVSTKKLTSLNRIECTVYEFFMYTF